MSVTELSLSRFYRDVAFLRGLYAHPRLRNRNNRWRMKQERVRARRMADPDPVEILPHREVVIFGKVTVEDEWWPWPISKARA